MNATAIYICAPNDRNGNPRRGWLFTVNHGGHEWHEEGYEGQSAIRTEYLRTIAQLAPRVQVTAGEYNRIRKTYAV
jgi:hypothetical protein